MSYYDLLVRVNKEETISQEKLFSLYARVHRLMHSCIYALVSETNYLQLAISDIGAEIAAKLDHNRSIYKRSVAFKDGKIIDLPKKQKTQKLQNKKFLCQCMDLQLAMVKGDVSKQLQIVDNVQLSSILFEEFIYSWLYKVGNYLELSDNYINSFIARSGETNDNTHNAQTCLCTLMQLEAKYGLDPVSAFRLIHYVKIRMHAISIIYDKILRAYMRAVLGIARTQASDEDHVLDNFQEGTIGLMRAISTYDYLSNARFHGYAKWWIRQAIIFNLKQSSSTIKITTNTWQHYTKLEQIRAKCEARIGKMSLADLAIESGYTEKHVENIYTNMQVSQLSSLDYQLNDDGLTLMTVRPSMYPQTQEEPKNENLDNISVLIEKLPYNLQKIVCLRFGLVASQELDKNEIRKEKCKQILAKSF